MSKKYVIEIKPEYEDSFKGLMILGAKDSNLFVDTLAVDAIEELNSDYINEHFGDLQDEAYKQGYEDGKKSVEDEGLRNNINLIVTQCGYSLDEINDMIQKMRDERQ